MTGDEQRLTSRVDTVQRGRSRYTVIRVPEELAAAARAAGTRRVAGVIDDVAVNAAINRAPVVDGPFLWAGATLLRRPRAEPGEPARCASRGCRPLTRAGAPGRHGRTRPAGRLRWGRRGGGPMPGTVDGFVGVYHADGGVRGELAYAIGKVRGTAHCALCDITHRGVRTRAQWTAMVRDLGVPFELVHLNERDADVRAASAERTPCVLARTADRGLVPLLGPEDLDGLGGDVAAFADRLAQAVAEAGLSWPRTPGAVDGGR